MTINLGRVGRSPAGLRIWAAGEAFQASIAPPKPSKPSLPQLVWVRVLSPDGPNETTLTDILREVAIAHGVSESDMRSHRRLRGIVDARFEYFYRAVQETARSFPEIGRMIKKDHSSVYNGCRKYAAANNLPLPRGMV